MMLRAASSGGYEPNLEVQAGTWIGGATNLMTMLSPADVAPWFPGNLESLAYRHPWGEATPTYGWGALALAAAALALYAAHRIRARSGPGPSGRALLWGGLVLLTGTILALGPVLRLTETAHVPLAIEQYGQRLSALMPYTWLVQLPVLQDVRVPSRFVMLGMLGAAMLAGFGFAALWRRGVLGRTLALAAIAFAVVEAGFTDGGALQKWVPLEREKLYAPVRADKSSSRRRRRPARVGRGDVRDGPDPGPHRAELRATEHGHPIAEGYITRLAPRADREARRAPVLQGGAGAAGRRARRRRAAAARATRTCCAPTSSRCGIGWVVQWPSASKRVPGFLRSLGFTPVRRSDGITLWRAPPPAA